jgi:hypothetical protein
MKYLPQVALFIAVFALLTATFALNVARKRTTDVYECGTTLKYCYPGTVPAECTFQDTLELDVPREFCS